MPEVDVLYALEWMVLREINRFKKFKKRPLMGSLVLYSRVFVTGTAAKAYSLCSTDSSRYHTGPLCVWVRGTELFLACGHHGVCLHFGLEATLLCVSLEDLADLTAEDCPGPNKDKAKATHMRSFKVLQRFNEPGSSALRTKGSINIFAAIVCENCVFIAMDFSRIIRMDIISLSHFWSEDDLNPISKLWPTMWDFKHGPDWLFKTHAAQACLDNWRSAILANSTAENNNGKVKSDRPLVQQICQAQNVFNGFGMHLLFAMFKMEIPCFMSQWTSDKYHTRICFQPNFTNPLGYHFNSFLNYVNHLYDALLQQGLLDPQCVINISDSVPKEHTSVNYKKLPVYKYKAGLFGTFYSVIRAQCPDIWQWAFNGVENLAEDLKHAGYQTILGPADFLYNKQNMINPNERGKPGRYPVIGRTELNVGVEWWEQQTSQSASSEGINDLEHLENLSSEEPSAKYRRVTRASTCGSTT
ncbi:hypothetical protein OBBRIDRAFT_808456 [Obba rivulosa]|uniref:Uncharacterized protein n=1 Tax=Obba rivulosa TaxID=1052685 RepID=A0A8E2ALE7_9APHY|nr:hypothetical protein OBBRIDRAFT_808456 [Obba rivulosa]